MKNDLVIKACPFCGGRPDIYHDADITPYVGWRIICRKCAAMIIGNDVDDVEDVLEAWNQRVGEVEDNGRETDVCEEHNNQ